MTSPAKPPEPEPGKGGSSEGSESEDGESDSDDEGTSDAETGETDTGQASQEGSEGSQESDESEGEGESDGADYESDPDDSAESGESDTVERGTGSDDADTDESGESSSPDWELTDDEDPKGQRERPLPPERQASASKRTSYGSTLAQAEWQTEKAALEHAAFDPRAEHARWHDPGSKRALEIHRHSAMQSAQSIGHGGWRAGQSGAYVKAPGRLWQDGKVFARPGHYNGGMLFDGSGSMRWNQAKAEAAARVLPGVWIGFYSAHREAAEPGGYWGMLCIVAERGKVGLFTPLDPGEQARHTGGNQCDAECLAYMARAVPGPKVWISDGQVCLDLAHYGRCNAIMKAHRIVRVDTAEQARDYLAGRKVEGYRTSAYVKVGEGTYGYGSARPEWLRLK
jgi:hypothetical protein